MLRGISGKVRGGVLRGGGGYRHLITRSDSKSLWCDSKSDFRYTLGRGL